MFVVSETFLQAVRNPHAIVVEVDVYFNGVLLLQNIAINGGTVNVHSGDGVRRTLDLDITDRALWDQLDTIGIEIAVKRGIRFPDGNVELCALGVFVLDTMSMSMSPGGIEVRGAPDRWAQVQRHRFETPTASVRTNRIQDEAYRLVADVVDFNTATFLTTNSAVVGALVWDRERDAAVIDLAKSISCEIFFDVHGDVVIREAPYLSQTPVWTVDASASGVMLGGNLQRDRSRTYNVVVASMSAIDGRTPFPPQTAADTDPTSRTYVGGPFGRVPYFYSSPTFRTAAQALASAQTMLRQMKAPNAQITLDAVVNPALDRGDVITVLTPSGISELHMIDSLTVPLDVGGVQKITTKSSRPEGDVPAGE